jgi:ABC-type glycerol-3-phosphate transport system permease component
MFLMLIVSFSSERSIMSIGYSFAPREFTAAAYKFLFSDSIVFGALGVSVLVTVAGTAVSLFLSAMCAYAMFKPTVKYRNALAFFMYFPTLINAGLVPWYINIAFTLHMKNSLFALIVPHLISTYNIFLIRNYFKSIPYSLVESAALDGATDFKIFFSIIMPVSLPILATITLFVSLSYWNDWYLAAWFIDSPRLYPLQYFLFRISNMIEYIKLNGATAGSAEAIPEHTVSAAAMFVSMGPIIFVYPYLQKYFIKGIMVGGVKG